MNAALVGCGAMGRAAAEALACRLGARRLLLSDADPAAAEALTRWLGELAPGCEVVVVPTDRAVRDADVVVVAAPWPATVAVAGACAAAGRPLAFVARPDYAEIAGVASESKAAGVPLLGPIGLEPGLVELLAHEAATALDTVEHVRIVCGGIPVTPRPPLGYVRSFGGPGYLPIAPRAAFTVTGGAREVVPRFSGVESVEVDEVGTLEAYHDGMLPWLPEDPVLAAARTITQKTLRWPGFAGTVRTLDRLGLLSDEPLDGIGVAPREVVERVLQPATAWRDGSDDVVVARCRARGTVAGLPAEVSVEVRDRYDGRTGLSAMARTTGYTLAACAHLLASGRLTGAGWLRPHEALPDAQRNWLLGWLGDQGMAVEREPGEGTVHVHGTGTARTGARPTRLDALAVGVGPSNLSLAALLHPVRELSVTFCERKERFTWHEGLMLPGSALQVHWLKDLVTLVDPTSRFSFLSFLSARNRLYRAINTQRWTVPRREFEQYYQWVAGQLDSVRFGVSVESVTLGSGTFRVETSDGVLHARDLVLGVGTTPRLPAAVRDLVDGQTVFHASSMVERPRHYAGRRIAVAGGGQSGAEIVRYLLGDRQFAPASVVWASRRMNFAPLDDSPFTNEYFMPNYSAYFHSLDLDDRAALVEQQRLASDGISGGLLLDLYRRFYDLELLEEDGSERRWRLLPDTRLVEAERVADGIRVTWESRGARTSDVVDMLVCATGYEQALPPCLAPLLEYIALADGRPLVREDFSLAWDGPAERRIFLQNGARHAFGIADPNLSLASWRSAKIVNALLGKELYPVGPVSATIDWPPIPPHAPADPVGGSP